MGSCRLASWVDVIEGDGGGCTLLASVGAPEDSKERWWDEHSFEAPRFNLNIVKTAGHSHLLSTLFLPFLRTRQTAPLFHLEVFWIHKNRRHFVSKKNCCRVYVACSIFPSPSFSSSTSETSWHPSVLLLIASVSPGILYSMSREPDNFFFSQKDSCSIWPACLQSSSVSKTIDCINNLNPPSSSISSTCRSVLGLLYQVRIDLCPFLF